MIGEQLMGFFLKSSMFFFSKVIMASEFPNVNSFLTGLNLDIRDLFLIIRNLI